MQDFINGLFEASGAIFILLSVLKLYKQKVVRGVSWLHVGYFTAWGCWNLYYYPYLEQWFSFIGGLGIVVTNTFWLGQLVYYSWKEKK